MWVASLGGGVDCQQIAADPKGRICWPQMSCPGSLGEETGCLNFRVLHQVTLKVGFRLEA